GRDAEVPGRSRDGDRAAYRRAIPVPNVSGETEAGLALSAGGFLVLPISRPRFRSAPHPSPGTRSRAQRKTGGVLELLGGVITRIDHHMFPDAGAGHGPT